MGISGLLPLLKSVQKPCNLKQFAGQTIGVDAYGWLHRGTAGCAIELAQGKPTTKFVDFAMNRVRMLIHFGIIPYIVFDGDYLPSKACTEKDRAGRRKESRKYGLELLRAGKISQAHLELQKAVDVTPEMARMLIEELKHHNIQYVVAPYEADSQLVYLERKGIISGIISEDSDMLVFGAKCLITKLDKYGECVEVNRNRFTACREVSLIGWTDADFRRMAILSGCDYLAGIGSMGLKTAYRMLRKHKTVERLVKAAQFDGKFKVQPGYLESFIQAERTFLYQWVFCPISNKLVHLTMLDPDLETVSMPFIGEEVAPDLAYGVARGDLHPHTKRPLQLQTRITPRGKPLREEQTKASFINRTPSQKCVKPIESFFKPRRTPLAELDVNLFTPSPSQQVIMEQQRNSNGWEAVHAPQSNMQILQTAPQPARRVVSNSAAIHYSAPHPAKRQRLCSDFSAQASPDKAAITRSRFFTDRTTEPSPSIRNGKSRKKGSDSDFLLYSDDFLEDTLVDSFDVEDDVARPKKKMKVFNDDRKPGTNNESQSTVVSTETGVASQRSQLSGTFTSATSCSSSEPQSVSSASSTQQLEDFRLQFSYDSKTSSQTKHHKNQASLTRAKDVSNHVSATSKSKSVLRASYDDSSSTGVEAHQAEDPDSRGNSLIGDLASARKEVDIITPATPTKSGSHLFAPKEQEAIKGSEELLVPDSDEESIHSPRKPLLNLGRFAFGG